MDTRRDKSRRVIDSLFVSVFNSILDLEERSLDNRLTANLTIHEIHTICAIGYRDNEPMNVIAARLNVTLATLNACINRLVEKGYAIRERDPEDKRRVLITLTQRGREVLRVHNLFHANMIEAATADLSEDEEEALSKALVKLQNYFESLRGN